MATDPGREQAIRDGLAQFRMAGIIGEVDVPMRRVYVRGLEDVETSVIVASVDRLLKTPRRFPVTLPQWVEACAAVVEERRQDAARRAQAFLQDCPDCHGSGWSNAEGPNAVIRCNCHKRALALMAQADGPLPKALPAYLEGE